MTNEEFVRVASREELIQIFTDYMEVIMKLCDYELSETGRKMQEDTLQEWLQEPVKIHMTSEEVRALKEECIEMFKILNATDIRIISPHNEYHPYDEILVELRHTDSISFDVEYGEIVFVNYSGEKYDLDMDCGCIKNIVMEPENNRKLRKYLSTYEESVEEGKVIWRINDDTK